MKKKILIIVIMILSILWVPTGVKAATGQLNAGDIEMECVYDNGVSFTIFGNNESYGIMHSDFKLSNAIAPPYSTALTVFYKETEFAKEIIQSATCPDYIDYMVVEQASGDNKVSFQVYFRDSDVDKFCSGESYDSAFYTRQHVGGFTATSGYNMTFSVAQDSALSKRMRIYSDGNGNSKYDEGEKMIAFQFRLQSERIYFNNEVEPKRKWAFKNEGQQAASTPIYIKVSEYVSENGATFRVSEKDNVMTKVNIGSLSSYSSDYTQFICFKPSVKNIKNDRNDMAYGFSSIRHDFKYKKRVENSKTETTVVNCNTGYSLYKEVNFDEVPADPITATSICEVIPETSLLIGTVIYYLGMFIPLLLIILTGIDIAKLVISGNLEEELPKKKRVIVVRFVVAVCFFFIPLLIQLFVNSNYGMDFGDVSCLFAEE